MVEQLVVWYWNDSLIDKNGIKRNNKKVSW